MSLDAADSEAEWPEDRSRPVWLRVAAVGMAIMVVLIFTVGFPLSDGSRCPRPLVWDSQSCIDRDELIVLTNGSQTQADVAAAVAPFGGRIVSGLADAGIFEVLFPIDSVDVLHAIELELNREGFEAFPNRHDGQLFAWRGGGDGRS
jgi:hypothetical protein